ncbi:MAG: MarR family winged helix-turn-helix transcriptional regulator [Anaerolineales bacterium]|jgi:DNA-binding MarR family transcriptional regulator
MTVVDPFISTLNQWIEILMRRSMRNFIRYARESGLSMSQFAVLFHLSKYRTSGVTDLGDHLGLTSAAVSQLLERLVQQGLILRTEDPNDRRVKQIILSEKGKQVLVKGIYVREDWFVNLSENLSPAEKDKIIGALKLLIDRDRLLDQSTGLKN